MLCRAMQVPVWTAPRTTSWCAATTPVRGTDGSPSANRQPSRSTQSVSLVYRAGRYC
jgi:hypothetical protein